MYQRKMRAFLRGHSHFPIGGSDRSTHRRQQRRESSGLAAIERNMLSSRFARAASRRMATGVRGLSSVEGDPTIHHPRIDLHGLHARYANATYIAASKANALEKVEEELMALKDTAEKSEAFAQFLENPMISRDLKTYQVEEMLKPKVTDTTLNLMTTLAGNARLAELPKIVDTYEQLMKAYRGEVEAVIISADELTKAQTEAVASAMKNQVGKDEKVVLSTKVDPTILGGLQVQIGDQFLDLSVSSRIDELSRTVV